MWKYPATGRQSLNPLPTPERQPHGTKEPSGLCWEEYKVAEMIFGLPFQVVSRGVMKGGPERKKGFEQERINFLDQVALEHIHQGLFMEFPTHRNPRL